MRDRWILFACLLLLITTTTFAITDTNLVAYYKFDETSGTSIIDSKGSYNFTLSGGSVNNTGKINKAISINETINNLGIGYLGDNASVSFWNKYISGSSGELGALLEMPVTSNRYHQLLIDSNSTHYLFNSFSQCGGTNYNLNVVADRSNWNLITITMDSSKYYVYLNGVYKGSFTRGSAGSCNAMNMRIGRYNNNYYDEFGVWDRNLSQSEISALYNSGAGLTYPFIGISVDFNYVVRKDLNKILLTDTSNVSGVIETAWTWTNNGVTISTAQDYNLSATELTDYNICLHVDTNQSDINGDKCYAFNTGDWTAPITTFSSSQYPNETKQKLTFVCTDNNSGCKYLNYNIDSNVWIQVANTGTKDINYSGTGSHSIQYFSTDNSDNNEATKTSTFTTYGIGQFQFFDENTDLPLNGVIVNDGTNTWTLTDNTLTINYAQIEPQQKIYTFTKEGYGTRHYTTELNQYTSFNKQILLLPETLAQNTPLTVFSPTLTLLPNTYIEFYKPDKNNKTIERIKTNQQGQATINISRTDTNYWAIIDQGTYTYKPTLLTVNPPKNELTGQDINTIANPFNVVITGPNHAMYSNRTSAVSAYLLTNTSDPYIVQISDSNNLFFPRNFQLIFQGNPLSYTLNPYLLSYVDGISVKVATYQQDSMIVTVYPNVRVDIYKSTGYGNILLETKITDAKGEALSILNPGDTYTFNIYTLDSENNTTAIKFNGSTDVPIKITGSTVALIITKTSVTQVDSNLYSYHLIFDKSVLEKQALGIENIKFNILNPGNNIYDLTYYLDYNGTQISNKINIDLIHDVNRVFDLNFAWVDVPQDAKFLDLKIFLFDLTTQKVLNYSQTFTLAPKGTVDLVDLFKNGVRNELFGCTTGQSCYPSAIAWSLFSIIIMVILFIQQGYGLIVNPFSFVILMALGTFLNWVPIEITMVITLIAIGLKLMERN